MRQSSWVRSLLLCLALAVAALVVTGWLRGWKLPTSGQADSVRRIEFVAVNAAGEFLSDLRPDELEMTEDGVPIRITSFVTASRGRTIDRLRPVTPTNVSISEPDHQGSIGRIVLIVIDDLSFRGTEGQYLHDTLRAIRGKLIGAGTVFGIVSTGPSATAVDLTYDVSRYDAVMRTALDGGFGRLPDAGRPDDVQRISFGTLKDLLNSIGRLKDRRKAVLVITNGYDPPNVSAPALSQLLEKLSSSNEWISPAASPSSSERDDTSALSLLQDLIAAARRANATVNILQPPTHAEAAASGEGVNTPSRLWLRAMAEGSTGLLLEGDQDLNGFLDDVDRRLTEYHVLTYDTAGRSNSSPSKISLKLTRPATTILYRRWQ